MNESGKLKEYNSYIDIDNYFKEIESKLKTTNLVNLDTSETIIRKLEDLKNSDFFIQDSAFHFIDKIYRICYEYMKCEFLYTDQSLLFDYFLSNEHDFNYINFLIDEEINNFTSSINYITGIKKLEKEVLVCKTHYMYKNVVLQLAKMTYKSNYISIIGNEISNILSLLIKIKYESNFPKNILGNPSKTFNPSKSESLNFIILKGKYKKIREYFYKLLNDESEFLTNSKTLIDMVTENISYLDSGFGIKEKSKIKKLKNR